MKVVGLGVLLVVLLGAAGCAGSPATAPSSTAVQDCGSLRTSAPDCAVYVADRATQDGVPVDWLPRSPIRLWVDAAHGERTAVVDAPVNTYSDPVPSSGLAWTGQDGSASTVGCASTCAADELVGSFTSTPAGSVTDVATGAITVTAGSRTVRFVPTAAPVHPRSCDSTSIEPLTCTRSVSVAGTEDGEWVPSLNTAPITVTVDTTGKRQIATVRTTDGTSWTLPIVQDGSDLVSAGTDPHGGHPDDFLRAFFAGRVVWQPHFSAVLLVSGDRTLQLEGAN